MDEVRLVPVFVDDVRFPYRHMVMCHMFADSEGELHAMADAIGVSRRWFQRPPRAKWRHYDICVSKKRLAIANGAILTDRYGALEHVARLNGDSAMLERIARRRSTSH
jgi:hypothetical protein